MEDKKLDSKVKKMIENYSDCKYKKLLNYSGYIKGLLISTLNNCLKDISSEKLVGKEFCYIYRDIKEKENSELNGITEKYISRKNNINELYYNRNVYDEKLINNINLLKRINFFFDMLFIEEILWCLEYLKDDDTILDKEQEEIYVYLSGVGKMYLDLTYDVISKIGLKKDLTQNNESKNKEDKGVQKVLLPTKNK